MNDYKNQYLYESLAFADLRETGSLLWWWCFQPNIWSGRLKIISSCLRVDNANHTQVPYFIHSNSSNNERRCSHFLSTPSLEQSDLSALWCSPVRPVVCEQLRKCSHFQNSAKNSKTKMWFWTTMIFGPTFHPPPPTWFSADLTWYIFDPLHFTFHLHIVISSSTYLKQSYG